MKRKKTAVIILLILIFISVFTGGIVKAEDGSESDGNLESTVSDMLDKLDLSELENYSQILDGFESFKGKTFKEKLIMLMKGDIQGEYSSVFSMIFSGIIDNIKSKMPVFISIFGLLILCGIINMVKPQFKGKSVSEIAYFLTFAVVISLTAYLIYEATDSAVSAIETMTNQIEIIFPIMLTLMTVTGGTSSVGVYNPAMLFVSNSIVIIIKNVVFPIVTLMYVISVVGNLGGSIKLKSLYNFFQSLAKWIIGLITAVFSVFITVQGLTVGMYDGISLRAIKYTVNSSLPIVGGLIKDGMDMILASAVLIKNAVGTVAIILIFSAILEPVITVIAISLLLKLLAAVTEPISDKRMTDFLGSVSNTLNFTLAGTVIIALMYFIIIVLLICSANMLF